MIPVQMKKILPLSITAVLLATLTLNTMPVNFAASSSTMALKSYKVGDVFQEKGIQAGKFPYVTNLVNQDFTGDKIKDQLIIVGDRYDKTATYHDSFTFVLRDGKTKKQIVYKPKMTEGMAGWGYTPVVEMSDINNDGVQDLLFSSFSGGTGGFVYYDIVTMKGGVFKQIVSQKALSGLTITGKYIDGFKAELTLKDLGQTAYIDLSYNKELLIEMKYYSADGKLLTPVEPWSGPLVNISGNASSIWGMQAIKGIANADTIGVLHVTYTLEKGKLIVNEVRLESTLYRKNP